MAVDVERPAGHRHLRTWMDTDMVHKKEQIKPDKFESVLGIVDYKREPHLDKHYQLEAVFWNGKAWNLQWSGERVDVLEWFPIPVRMKRRMNKLFGKEIYK